MSRKKRRRRRRSVDKSKRCILNGLQRFTPGCICGKPLTATKVEMGCGGIEGVGWGHAHAHTQTRTHRGQRSSSSKKKKTFLSLDLHSPPSPTPRLSTLLSFWGGGGGWAPGSPHKGPLSPVTHPHTHTGTFIRVFFIFFFSLTCTWYHPSPDGANPSVPPGLIPL